MVSREHQRVETLHEKLQLLRSITNSHAENESSIIMDASRYIEELKEKVERLNQDIVTHGTQSSTNQDTSSPSITVETLEKGFLISVHSSQKSCQGLLMCILEAFEYLNLNVVEASATCTQQFKLEAISVHGDGRGGTNVDAKVVRQAILEAIKNWHPTSDDQD